MKNILILDTETTGLDPNTDRIIELGLVLWNVEHACILACYSDLIKADSNPAEAINHIPSEAVSEYGKSSFTVMAALAHYESIADAVVAHNAKFDKSFVGSILHKPWICSMDDLEWPATSGSQSLVNIALAHGVGVMSAHRALADCLLLARLFERVAEMGVDVNAMLERGLLPRKVFRALVDYKDKDLAKSNKFRWDSEKRQWTRRMLPEAAALLPFAVEEVGE